MTVTPNEVAKVQAEAAADAKNGTTEHLPGGNPDFFLQTIGEVFGVHSDEDTLFLKDVYYEAHQKAK